MNNTEPEIPLLRCSNSYAKRLIDASKKFGDSKYKFYRRVNWSYRYSKIFYEHEAGIFKKAPKLYIEGKCEEESSLDDIYTIQLSTKQVGVVAVKVIAHWIFFLSGIFFGLRKSLKYSVYRKSYVDDIEAVFDPGQPDVLRAIYPFPLSIGRQIRYFLFLIKNRYRFKTDGNPYSPRDFLKFLLKRNLVSLLQMESRAQIRQAYAVADLGFSEVQLSDEFDVGSLDFCRAIRRLHVRIVNSAHGVGSYLPIHAYNEFHVLTGRQIIYYMPIHSCEYKIRLLNLKKQNCNGLNQVVDRSGVLLVFLSQTSFSVSQVVSACEEEIVGRLAYEFSETQEVSLLYKAHPNNQNPTAPVGFSELKNPELINGHPGVIWISLFSTCYIDPNFCGKKYLIQTGLIFPEIIFDDTDNIIGIDDFVKHVRNLIGVQVS